MHYARKICQRSLKPFVKWTILLYSDLCNSSHANVIVRKKTEIIIFYIYIYILQRFHEFTSNHYKFKQVIEITVRSRQ